MLITLLTEALLTGLIFVLVSLAGLGLVSQWFSGLRMAVFLGIAAGWALVSYAMLLGGFLGWYRPLFFYLVMAAGGAGAIAGARVLRQRWSQEWGRHWSGSARTQLRRFPLLWLVSLLLLMAGLAALAPTTGWDANTYHLVLPSVYLQAGRMVSFETIAASYFQLFPQMQYLFGMGLGLSQGVQLIPWFYLVSLCGLVLLGGNAFGRISVRVIALAVLLTVPAVWFATYEVLVDIQLLFYLTLGGIGLVHWHLNKHQSKRWLTVFAVCVGIAMGGKVTNTILLVWAPLIVYLAQRSDGIRSAYRSALWTALLSGLVALPWYMHGWLTRGNPIWPFFNSFISADLLLTGFALLVGLGLLGWWTIAMVDRGVAALVHRWSGYMMILGVLVLTWAAFFSSPALSERVWHVLLGPLAMTFWPEQFGGDAPRIGPLVLGFLPFYWLGREDQPRLRQIENLLIFWAVAFYVCWMLAFDLNDTRHLMVVFPLLMLILARRSQLALQPLGKPGRRALVGLVTLALLYNGAILAKELLPRLSAYTDSSAEAYLSRVEEPLYPGVLKLPAYPVYRYANKHLSPQDLVLVVGQLQWYYLDIPFLNGRPDQQSLLDYNQLPTTADLYERLRELGVTHVISYAPERVREIPSLQVLGEYLEEQTRLYEDNRIILYQVAD